MELVHEYTSCHQAIAESLQELKVFDILNKILLGERKNIFQLGSVHTNRDRYWDREKMSCIELCGGVDSALRH